MTRKQYYLEQLQDLAELASTYINNYCDEDELTEEEIESIEFGDDDIVNAIHRLYDVADLLSMK